MVELVGQMAAVPIHCHLAVVVVAVPASCRGGWE